MTINIQDYITVSAETLGGQPVFKGTRVPVESLFDYLIRDYSIMDFLQEFPTVSDIQATAVLKIAADLINAYTAPDKQ